MLETIEKWLADWAGTDEFSLRRLKGDASLRAFYRMGTFSGETWVVMDSGRSDLSSFVDVHSLLSSTGFPVPKLVRVDAGRGLVIMEDLGDTRLLDLEGDARRRMVEDALDLLTGMQRTLDRSRAGQSVAGRRSFTASFFMAELEHTVQHLFFRLLRVPEERIRALQDEMRELCERAASGPFVFCHRDYHSANLMVSDRGLVMVDWQDARMGPQEYDLVSLLRDSYFDYGEGWMEKACLFLDSTAKADLRQLARVACQRSLKAAGTFAYQYRAFGRSHYLVHIPRTMRYLAGYSRIDPELEPLVDDVYDLLLSFSGEIDLRGFEESDRPGLPDD